MGTRIRTLLATLSLVGAAILLVLLLGEAATRLFGNTGPSLQVQDPEIGKRYRADYHETVYVPESDRRVELRFNAQGFRDPDRPFAKPADVRRIAVLGDSMIVAVATDEEQTLVRKLETLLNRSEPGALRWEALNFGVSSSSTGQQLALFRHLVSRYSPDVVVCAFNVGNDLADNSRRLTSARRIYFDLDETGELVRLPFAARSRPLSNWANQYSRFYIWLKGRMAILRGSARELAGVPNEKRIFSTRPDDDLAHAWTLTGRLLEALRDEVRAGGGELVVLTIPSSEQVYDDRWQTVLDLAGADAGDYDADFPDRQLARITGQLGVPLLTMTEEFRARAPRRSSAVPEELLFWNGTGHINVAGQELAAVLLHDFLRSRMPGAPAERSGAGADRLR